MRYTILSIVTTLLCASLIQGCGGSGGSSSPAPFTWRSLESGPHIGNARAGEQVFRTEAEFKAAYPNSTLVNDWSKYAIASISLGERPSTHDAVKVLGVESSTSEVVIRYSIDSAQFGLWIFCQPGAFVQFSQTDLPVRFEKQGVFPF